MTVKPVYNNHYLKVNKSKPVMSQFPTYFNMYLSLVHTSNLIGNYYMYTSVTIILSITLLFTMVW